MVKMTKVTGCQVTMSKLREKFKLKKTPAWHHGQTNTPLGFERGVVSYWVSSSSSRARMRASILEFSGISL